MPPLSLELLTIALGALPITEGKGAVLVALTAFQFPLLKGFILAMLGNMLGGIAALIFLEKFAESARHRSYGINRILTWIFERTRIHHSDHFHHWKWATIALFIFVLTPVPLTGVWSGAVAAILFGIPFKKAALTLYAGAFISTAFCAVLIYTGVIAVRAAL